MTTKLLIQNDATSNGDVIVRVANACYVNPPVHGKTIPTRAIFASCRARRWNSASRTSAL